MPGMDNTNTKIAILLLSISLVVYSMSIYFRNVGLLLLGTGTLLACVSLLFQRMTSFGISAVSLCVLLAASEFVAPLVFAKEKNKLPSAIHQIVGASPMF
jgi:hypothetical protein